MKSNAPKKNALARRRDVMKSLEEVRGRLTLPQLADDAIAIVDPKLGFPRRLKTAVAAQPLVAALLLGGATWLMAGSDDSEPPVRPRQNRP